MDEELLSVGIADVRFDVVRSTFDQFVRCGLGVFFSKGGHELGDSITNRDF